MTITELIDKHVDNWRIYPRGPLNQLCKEFAIELLEMVIEKSSVRDEVICSFLKAEIDEALATLKEKP